MHHVLSAVAFFCLLFFFTYSVMATADSNIDKLEKVYQKLLPKFKEAVEIRIDQLSTHEVVFVDVREAEERRVSMIPGAIGVDEFLKASTRYQNAQLVAYCTIGFRSGKFAIKLRKQGFDVKNLKGGVLAWAHAGKLFKTATGVETKRVHVYDDDWDLLPKGYVAVW